MKSHSVILVLVCAGCVSTSQQQKTLIATVIPARHIPAYSKAEDLKLVKACVAILEQHYVDSFSYDPTRDTTLNALRRRLDPFTFYQTEEGSKRYMSRVENAEDEKIGISHVYIGDTVVVWHVLPGSAAREIGLLPGDRILSVGKYSLIGLKCDSVREILKTQLPCKAVVLRPKEWKRYTVKFFAKPVKDGPTGEYFTLDDSTGYLSLHHFTSGSYKGLSEGVKRLGNEGGMRRLILDLRGNSGGYLDQAVKMVNFFLDDTSMIVQLKSVHHDAENLFSANGSGQGKLPLAIIVNGHSASASEVFAGVLQDKDRAIIIGSPSFGKGLCQKEMRLFGADGSLHITTSKILMPSGRTVQKFYHGDSLLDFDIPDDDIVDNFDHHLERSYRNGDTATYFTKNGRKVYGAMGVIPDIIAPWFTDKQTREYAYNDSTRYEMYRFITENFQDIFERYSTLDSFVSLIPKSREWAAARVEMKKRMFEHLGEQPAKKINSEDVAHYLLTEVAEMYFGEERTCISLLETDRRVIAARKALDTKWKLIHPKSTTPAKRSKDLVKK